MPVSWRCLGLCREDPQIEEEWMLGSGFKLWGVGRMVEDLAIKAQLLTCILQLELKHTPAMMGMKVYLQKVTLDFLV